MNIIERLEAKHPNLKSDLDWVELNRRIDEAVREAEKLLPKLKLPQHSKPKGAIETIWENMFSSRYNR